MAHSKHQLLKKINQSKELLFKDKGFRDMCKEYSVSPEVIYLIPIRFGDIDTSAKTRHGIIILNEQLLDKGAFESHIHYILHEILHFLQMITRKEATKKDHNEHYLDNEDEVEAFKYQVEFMGEDKAENYVEDLLDHHDVDDEEDREDKKEELLERIAQRTQIDERLNRNWINPYANDQLEFMVPNPKELDYRGNPMKTPMVDTGYGGSRSNTQKLKDEKEDERVRQPINLSFPEIDESHITYKPHTDKDHEGIKTLVDTLKAEPKRFPENLVNRTQNVLELKGIVPEEVKKRLVKAYSEMRAAAIPFKAAYEEANAIADVDNSFNYDPSESYAEVISKLPDFVIRASRRGIGTHFGWMSAEKDKSSYFSVVVDFLSKGISIFNVEPFKCVDLLKDLANVKVAMEKIVQAHNRRKQLLTNLPPVITKSTEKFLSQPDTQKFLKFMEENFADEKKRIIDTCVDNMLERSINDHFSFSIGSTATFQNYQEIFRRSRAAIQNSLMHNMRERANGLIHNELIELVTAEAARQNAKLLAYSDPDVGDLNQASKFLYATFGFDIKSVLHLLPHKQDTIVNAIQGLFDGDSRRGASYDGIREAINTYMERHIENKEGVESWASKATSASITEIAKEVIRYRIAKHLGLYKYPMAKKIVLFGRITPDNVTADMSKVFPEAPKELLKFIAKNSMSALSKSGNENPLAWCEKLSNSHPATEASGFAFQIALRVFSRSGKLSPDSFWKFFTEKLPAFTESIQRLQYNMPDKVKPDFNDIATIALRNPDTLESDLRQLNSFSDFIHNEGGDLSTTTIKSIISNGNFYQFNKFEVSKILIKVAVIIKSMGGPDKIVARYKDSIETMAQTNMISSNFVSNLQSIIKAFDSNKAFNPKSPETENLRLIIKTTESDIAAVRDAKELQKLLKDYVPKDKRLFNLDLSISPTLRFRVLQDKDPRVLRVGIETDCCQRIGGVGQEAAKDSFINPLAGVVILEEMVEGGWEILTQSYFHYVPTGNGFILDNVEANDANVAKSGISLEAAYAYLAQQLKANFNIGYFLAGKSYSKIDEEKFDTERISADPRHFSVDDPYTDFDNDDAIDLLKPNSQVLNTIPHITGETERKATAFGRNLDRIIRTAMV